MLHLGLAVALVEMVPINELDDGEINMPCNYCGSKLRDNAKFCGACGTKVAGSVTAEADKVPNAINLAPLPAGLGICAINIKRVNTDGPDSDGNLQIEVHYEVTNKCKEDWDSMEVRIHLLNEAGQIIEEMQDTHEQCVEASETQLLQATFYAINARLLGNNIEKAQVIISVVASNLMKGEIGLIDIPENTLELNGIKSLKFGDVVQVISGALWKTEPDDEGDSRVEIKVLIQNLTNKHLPAVRLAAEVIDRKGNELTDASGGDEVRPNSITAITGSGYCKHKKLIGAKAQISISVYSPFAYGYAQTQGLGIKLDQAMLFDDWERRFSLTGFNIQKLAGDLGLSIDDIENWRINNSIPPVAIAWLAAHENKSTDLPNHHYIDEAAVDNDEIYPDQLNFTSEELISSSANIAQENRKKFGELLASVGIEGDDLLSGYYFKNDPRTEDVGIGVFENKLRTAIEDDESSIGVLINGLRNFFASPDLFNFWRYSLLSKFLADLDVDLAADCNAWDALGKFGVDLPSCMSILGQINVSVEAEEITTGDYQEALQTVVACYLALALNSEESTYHVEQLIHLVALNSEIDGINISENTSIGSGEYSLYCRRMLEEFTGVCIDAPDGVDFEADGYFDEIDWDTVADKIMQELG